MSVIESVQPLRALDLTAVEAADVVRASSEALARQSVASIFGNWVLAAVLLGTTTVAAAHPRSTAVAAVWVFLVGLGRLLVAKASPRLLLAQPSLWRRLFRVGVLVSSVTWGAGGAAMVIVAEDHRDAWLVLMTLAGVTAAGITRLCRRTASFFELTS